MVQTLEDGVGVIESVVMPLKLGVASDESIPPIASREKLDSSDNFMTDTIVVTICRTAPR